MRYPFYAVEMVRALARCLPESLLPSCHIAFQARHRQTNNKMAAEIPHDAGAPAPMDVEMKEEAAELASDF